MDECKQIIYIQSNIILIDAKEHTKNHNDSRDNLVKFSSDFPIVKTVKYLGVVIHDTLAVQYRIQNFVNKLSGSVGILANVK